jgi:hypothetical protein
VTTEHAGLTLYSWGSDFQQDLRNRLEPPVFDALGRGGHYVLSDAHVLRTLWSEGALEMIDAWQDDAPSLADDAAWRSAAQQIEALGAFSATFSRDDGIAAELQALKERSGVTYGVEPEALTPPAVDALANGRDEAGAPYTALVRVYRTEVEARAAEPALTKLFSDPAFGEDTRRGKTAVDSRVDGTVLTLILRPSD